MLKKVLHYNDVSQELLNSVPKLKRGEQVRFKCYSIQPDVNSPRRFNGPYIKNVPATDTIWDPTAEKYVEIAFADQSNNSKGGSVAVMRTIKFVAPIGDMVLTGGKAIDEYLYYYMSLSNYDGGNPNRDVSKEAYYYKVDENKNAKEKRTKRSVKLDALNKATNMTAEEVRDFIAATGGNDKASLDILRDTVESWADKDPAEFMKKADDISANLKASVKRALDQSVITFDKEQMLFAWADSKEPIMTVPRSQGSDHIRDFVESCISDKKYDKVLATIKKSLKK